MAEYMEQLSTKTCERLKIGTALSGKARAAPEKAKVAEPEGESEAPAEDPNSYRGCMGRKNKQNIRISFDEKVKMTEKVKKLKPEDLTQFVHMVQELCPKAVADVDAKRLQIKVDDIEKNAFEKLTKMLDEKIGEEEEVREPNNKRAKTK